MSLHRTATILLVSVLLTLPVGAQARVALEFYSYNGGITPGNFPHAFVKLEGTLDETGKAVSESYGFGPLSIGPHVLFGKVAGKIRETKTRHVQSAKNQLHFTVPLSDQQYHAVIAEVNAWRDTRYSLDTRNCLHFVAALARIAGVKADVPAKLVRRPKAWLIYVRQHNPRLTAAASE